MKLYGTANLQFIFAFLLMLFSASIIVSTSIRMGCGNSCLVTVYFFDVGQGDAIFVDTNGLDMLIDGGPRKAGAALMGYLEALNVSRISFVVATHPHEDHIGGLVAVLNSSINVDAVLYSGESATTQVYSNFISLAQGKVTLAERGQEYVLSDDVNFTVLNPVQPLEFSDSNSNSIVLRLQAGNVAFLFAGDATFDAEESMLNAGLNVTSQVLKVAHHGSRYATSATFLNDVNPEYAVISAGVDNTYGHPHVETVQRLLEKGVTVYGTYLSGTIIMSTDGQTVQVHGNPKPVSEFPQGVVLCLILVLVMFFVFWMKNLRRSG